MYSNTRGNDLTAIDWLPTHPSPLDLLTTTEMKHMVPPIARTLFKREIHTPLGLLRKEHVCGSTRRHDVRLDQYTIRIDNRT